jgi:hypothetical protein
VTGVPERQRGEPEHEDLHQWPPDGSARSGPSGTRRGSRPTRRARDGLARLSLAVREIGMPLPAIGRFFTASAEEAVRLLGVRKMAGVHASAQTCTIQAMGRSVRPGQRPP